MNKFNRCLLTIFSASCLCAAQDLPEELTRSIFSDTQITPATTCISVKASGEVFVGVDKNGSLGKKKDYGSIVKLLDEDNDGKPDSHNTFAKIDSPRGLEAFGDKVYVLHGHVKDKENGKTYVESMDLSVLEDLNKDGVADGPPKVLVSDISARYGLNKKGADHCTNGIRMGIDGWIYIAVGDYGFANAKGADGTTLSMYAGGVARVRPDGSNFEIYTFGMRNIYDVAIDPFMNIFTYGNTNDGGGWNIRFTHQLQHANYGYPRHFMNFSSEIIPALVDLGGGSGVGVIYLSEPGWPAHLNNVPVMGDWTRRQVIFHPVKPDGPSFTTEQSATINGIQPSDMDCDASGRLYISAWGGAGFAENHDKGYVELVKPKGWKPRPFPKDLRVLKEAEIIGLLQSESSTARIHASQEILRRADPATFLAVEKLVADKNLDLAVRVAALYTFVQSKAGYTYRSLAHWAHDFPELREHCIRAMSNDKNLLAQSKDWLLAGIKDGNPRVRVQATIALGRLGEKEHADVLLSLIPEGAGVPKKVFIPKQTLNMHRPQEIKKDLAGTDGKLFLSTFNGKKACWKEPSLILEDGTRIPMDKLNWKELECGGNGKITVNKHIDGTPLVDKEGKPVKGWGVHSPSVIELTLPPNAMFFEATAFSIPPPYGDYATLTIEPGLITAAHATPTPEIIIPHLAAKSLVMLHAAEACLSKIGTPQEDGAFWALRNMHSMEVVDQLLSKLNTASDESKSKIFQTLARLMHKEIEYDGTHHWGGKPDTRGPYYMPQKWEASEKIAKAYNEAYQTADDTAKKNFRRWARLNRMEIPGIDIDAHATKETKPLEKKVADIIIEELVGALRDKKGDPKRGKDILLGGNGYAPLSCIGCHKFKESDRALGPDLDKIGTTMNKEQLAVAIIKPAQDISENWNDVIKNDGTPLQGVVYDKDENTTIVRNIAGVETEVAKSDIKEVKPAGYSIMGPHMVDHLSESEFVDLINYLETLK